MQNMVDRFTIRNILKFLLLFKHKGLLYSPLYYLLKDSLLSGDSAIPNIFEPYDLAELANVGNLQHLQRLFDLLHEQAVSIAKKQLDALYTDGNVVKAHQISNAQSIHEKKHLCTSSSTDTRTLASIAAGEREADHSSSRSDTSASTNANSSNSSTSTDGNIITPGMGVSVGVGEADTRGLIYGEVDFDSFQRILDTALTGLKPMTKEGKFSFVDLGSGTGKACLWAALTTPFSHILGIEIISGLHCAAVRIHEQFCSINHMACANTNTSNRTGTGTSKKDRKIKIKDVDEGDDESDSDDDDDDGENEKAAKIQAQTNNDHTSCVQFVEGSFLHDIHDWSESDLAFANSTCFPNELLMKLSVRSQLMRPGSRFITFTVSLDSPYWRVIYRERMNMSWGMATVFIQERLSDEQVRHAMMFPDDEAEYQNENENDDGV